MLCCPRLEQLRHCALIPGHPENALQSLLLWMEARNKITWLHSLLVMIFITFLLPWLSDFQQRVCVDLLVRRPEAGRLWGTPAAVGVQTHVQSHARLSFPSASPHTICCLISLAEPDTFCHVFDYFPAFLLSHSVIVHQTSAPQVLQSHQQCVTARVIHPPEHSSCRGILSIQLRAWAHHPAWENGDTALND